MAELVQQNWIFLVIALVVGLLVAWWIFGATRRTRVDMSRLDEGTPAKRNQALIDAPPATAATEIPLPTPMGMAGVGEAIQASVEGLPIEPTTTEAAASDDLTRIKGLGPKLAETLHALGVTSFAQIGAWTEADIDRIDAQLGRFQGRIRRDDWSAQARLLAAGDTAGYEAKFGKL